MSALDGGSVPPPGWGQGSGGVAWSPPPAAAAPVAVAAATAGQPATEAAVRWRINAAVIDSLIVYGVYLLVCLLLHWRVADPSHLIVLILLDVVYHFALESRDGQTIGKRQYGLRVVTVGGARAGPKAIAFRSVLRVIDSLPLWYLSGLISMLRTGPARRQRIGDVAADTKVIAVEGRSASRGTPGWMLPAATLLALAISVLAIIGFAQAGHEPLSSSQQAQFVAGCESRASGIVSCQCLLSRLEADGYDSLDSLKTVFEQAQAERLSGQPGRARDELTADASACRT